MKCPGPAHDVSGLNVHSSHVQWQNVHARTALQPASASSFECRYTGQSFCRFYPIGKNGALLSKAK